MSTAPVTADADAMFAAGKSKYVGNEIVPTDAVAWFNLTFIVWPALILLASNLTFWLATNCKVKKLPFDKSILAVLELIDKMEFNVQIKIILVVYLVIIYLLIKNLVFKLMILAT